MGLLLQLQFASHVRTVLHTVLTRTHIFSDLSQDDSSKAPSQPRLICDLLPDQTERQGTATEHCVAVCNTAESMIDAGFVKKKEKKD